MKRLSIRVRKPISAEDMTRLRALGCDERPYFSNNDAWAVFGASSDHEEEFRALNCVMNVEIMRVYGI